MSIIRISQIKFLSSEVMIMNPIERFKNAQFGMMVHFGLYSLLAGEYKGKQCGGVAEWIQAEARIPKAEYEKLATAFNPIYFDAEEWVLLAKAAGMKYIVVTSKHHEGFCLFNSEYDNYNCVKGTPFGRDIIGELADACRKHDMLLGLYYSQDMDWHEPNGGGWNMSWTNDWDFPDNSKKNYEQYFRSKVLPQVRELLTHYGDILLMWFDTPSIISLEQSRELFNLVKSLQPNCLVNTRIGNGLGDYRSMDDNELPEVPAQMSTEAPCTLNDTWGFKYFDNNWKPAEEVIRIREHCRERGANYLLNVGPDHLGRIPAPACDILKAVGKAK